MALWQLEKADKRALYLFIALSQLSCSQLSIEAKGGG